MPSIQLFQDIKKIPLQEGRSSAALSQSLLNGKHFIWLYHKALMILIVAVPKDNKRAEDIFNDFCNYHAAKHRFEKDDDDVDHGADMFDARMFTEMWLESRGCRVRIFLTSNELPWWERLFHRFMFNVSRLSYRMQQEDRLGFGGPSGGGAA